MSASEHLSNAAGSEGAPTPSPSATSSVIDAASAASDNKGEVASSALDKVKGMLGKKLRVRVGDGRLLEGDLQCLDRELNLILLDAFEYYYSSKGRWWCY